MSLSTLTGHHVDHSWGSSPFSGADLGGLLDPDLDPLFEAGVALLDLERDLERDRDRDLERDLERDGDLALGFLVLGERDLDLE